MTGKVSCEVRDGIAWINLDDGKVNVMSSAMLGEIAAAFDRAEGSADIVVLRSGRPGIFSAGFDLKVFAAGDAPRSLEMVRAGAELALRLMSFPLPTIGGPSASWKATPSRWAHSCCWRAISDLAQGDHTAWG